jgi:hypothetical protein
MKVHALLNTFVIYQFGSWFNIANASEGKNYMQPIVSGRGQGQSSTMPFEQGNQEHLMRWGFPFKASSNEDQLLTLTATIARIPV